jgi:iron complex transport system permease protein
VKAAPRLAVHHSSHPSNTVVQRWSGRSRHAIVITGMTFVLLAVFLLSLAISSVWVPLDQVVSILTGIDAEQSPAHAVINEVRLPRSLTAILAGAALGIAGLQMQTLFRNPLADPYALGIASGASLGVALVLLTSGAIVSSVFASSLGLAGDAAVTAASIAGAALAITVVLGLSNRVESPATVLILGLMFGYAAQAFVTVLVAGTDPDKLQRWVAWGFGSFSGVQWPKMIIFAPLVLIGLGVSLVTTKQLNALLLGESYASSMGLNVRRMRLVTMAGASILGGVVTAFCGPIAFLGIAIPHMCRGLLGTSDHRSLVPATILMGGIVALTAQIVSLIPALLPGNSGAFPLNAVTSLIGAPVVVIVLMRNRRGAFTA